MKVKIVTILILFTTLATILVSFVYAYFFTEDGDDQERTIGEVLVDYDLYFLHNGNRVEGIESKILTKINDGHNKTGVFEIVLANLNDPRHLNNLRIDFKVNSNIETYFRIKLYDSVVIRSTDGKRETALTNTGIKYLFKEYEEGIEYEEDDGDSEFWYLDKTTNWFYYKSSVIGRTNELTIPFIYGNTGYEGPTQNRVLEIVIIIEAVQGYRGPNENWGLQTQPWPDGGDWYEEENTD